MILLRALGAMDVNDGRRDLGPAVAQPKRFALLAYLALAQPRGFQRRDRLVALFWPELDQEHARAALRKAVHGLRATLGEQAIVGRGAEDLALGPAEWWCDVVAFEEAADAGRHAAALALYRGDLLDGLFISGAPEFERWVERERARLRARAAAAAWALADAAESAGVTGDALQLGRRAVALSPDDESAVRRLIALLDRVGDRAGALHAYADLSRQLAADFAAEPAAETQALIEAVRQRVARISGPEVAAPVYPVPRPAPRRVARLVTVAGLALVAIGAGTLQRWRALPVGTTSRPAYDRYQEGAAAYAHGDFVAAQRAFELALVQDTGFALAAYYAALSAGVQNDNAGYTHHYARALRLAEHARRNERLLIRATWADRQGEPDALALAESLAASFPNEPAGHDLLGRALLASGDFLGAIPHLAIAAAADSLSLRPGAPGPCQACGALDGAWFAYFMADSLGAAERVARDWVRRQPASADAWHHLAMALEDQNRLDEALAANRTAGSLRTADISDAVFPGILAIRGGRFAEADRLLRRLTADSSPGIRQEAHWNLVTSLRNQGRLGEALVEAHRFRAGAGPVPGNLGAGVLEAQVLFEMGRPREAAALFDSIAAQPPHPYSPARAARDRAWYLTHTASALAAAGDTARLAALADSIESTGARSNFGRDHLLHHHVRGLLLQARGRLAEAAGEFRLANYSWTGGFTRNSFELAAVLLRMGRPAEALEPLQGALHGPQEASALYCTLADVHWEIARAFDAARRPDSAAAHYRWVVAAWAHADPVVRARRHEAQRRLAALGG
ncbi:MAG TPA: BTAD domain-containing putative transcriptional regulator [Gemmatimonadales bacterium]